MKKEAIAESETATRLAAAQADLSMLIARWAPVAGNFPTLIEGLTLYRRIAPTVPRSGMYPPGIAVIAQGLKRVTLGKRPYICDAQRYLVTAVDLPTVAQIIEASADRPYLSIMLTLDPGDIAQMLVDTKLPNAAGSPPESGMAVSDISLALVNALCRLVGLLDEPENIPVLAPLIMREILYRLLVGEQSQRLRQMSYVGSHCHHIGKAIGWLKENYTQPLKVGALAAQVPMALSTFNHHFRVMTGMSPLQYHKRLRLHEARRLMLTERVDAATAAHRVGYESPSQFSREYGRLFGAPPLRDISRWRDDVNLISSD
jgi:AraC-like DNA-binding protein